MIRYNFSRTTNKMIKLLEVAPFRYHNGMVAGQRIAVARLRSTSVGKPALALC